jgi:hypothetical protein
MRLQLNENPMIEDLRKHPSEALKELRALLAAGAEARVDPRRKNFYELEDRCRVFYVHVCPSGKVLLLAIWDKDSPAATRLEDVQTSASAFC